MNNAATTAPAAPDYAIINGATVAEWNALADTFAAEAQASRQRSADSFERCDTDGFLSQWALDTLAREYDRKAQWARDFGYVTTTALIALDGVTVIAYRTIENQYGTSWVTTDAYVAAGGKRFLNDSNASKEATRLANNRRKGFTLGSIEVAGTIGLHGASAVSVAVVGNADEDAIERGEFRILNPEFSIG